MQIGKNSHIQYNFAYQLLTFSHKLIENQTKAYGSTSFVQTTMIPDISKQVSPWNDFSETHCKRELSMIEMQTH